ncbi:MAG: 2-oxoglutarate-dependent dioxygenase, partial [Burkholderiales bacterium PBB5]
MNAQAVTPELRRWIIEQAQAGCRPEDVLAAMRNSGWAEDVAVAALEDTLRGFLDQQGQAQQLPAPVPVPEPSLAGSPSRLWALDREVTVLLAMRNPRVVVFGGLLSDDECDQLVADAQPRMTRSETVVNSTGGNEVNAARTSEGMFFGRGESPLCRRIEDRIAALVHWPVQNGEGLQILHYRPGAEYKPHHDYFDPAQPGMAAVLKRG